VALAARRSWQSFHFELEFEYEKEQQLKRERKNEREKLQFYPKLEKSSNLKDLQQKRPIASRPQSGRLASTLRPVDRWAKWSQVEDCNWK